MVFIVGSYMSSSSMTSFTPFLAHVKSCRKHHTRSARQATAKNNHAIPQYKRSTPPKVEVTTVSTASPERQSPYRPKAVPSRPAPPPEEIQETYEGRHTLDHGVSTQHYSEESYAEGQPDFSEAGDSLVNQAIDRGHGKSIGWYSDGGDSGGNAADDDDGASYDHHQEQSFSDEVGFDEYHSDHKTRPAEPVKHEEPRHAHQVDPRPGRPGRVAVPPGLMEFCCYCGVRLFRDTRWCGKCGKERMEYVMAYE
ncbi:hypothetical protein J8273_5281 [Carpediemonas membranifera]|uniref:Uncharacterized protein n=1 Tax=Carpediemonas membranifera TaxID=201153 RepID=A0A8J6B8M7_9EUKA|nr:hypothetical protein J8273_5281 [Carpediemonas membranifera]|eukprot:KAG9392292.1 hypothetical protein J8273_5281 [Carpediemonas membranifera]